MSPQFPLDRRLGGSQNQLDIMEKRKMSPSAMNQTAIFIPSSDSLVIVNVEPNLKKLTFFNIHAARKHRIAIIIHHVGGQMFVKSCNKYQNNCQIRVSCNFMLMSNLTTDYASGYQLTALEQHIAVCCPNCKN
jgi:hypothetical protein